MQSNLACTTFLAVKVALITSEFCLFVAHRLQSFTIELTDHDPRNGQGPPNLPFHECASHSGQMQSGETISVTCKDPMNTRGRYLFISAIAERSVFHLAEVEVFSGTLC